MFHVQLEINHFFKKMFDAEFGSLIGHLPHKQKENRLFSIGMNSWRLCWIRCDGSTRIGFLCRRQDPYPHPLSMPQKLKSFGIKLFTGRRKNNVYSRNSLKNFNELLSYLAGVIRRDFSVLLLVQMLLCAALWSSRKCSKNNFFSGFGSMANSLTILLEPWIEESFQSHPNF